ncbi:hypothetical protein ACFPK9_12405 [Rubritalea spongiae]|uniref:Uncharacterized protein n=1 Tax=Rubritalea spongiae TaxID=430797 RepID=A0ABW5DZL3_9BACT
MNGKLHGDVEMPKYEFGKDLQFEGENELEIVFAPKIYDEGEVMPKGLPSTKVDARWEKFLIVAVTDTKNPTFPMKLLSLNATDNYFSNGDFMFVNFTPNYVLGTFGKKKVNVAPMKLKVANMSDSMGQFLDVKLNYVEPQNKKQRWMVRQGWRVLDDRRTVVFFYVPDGRTTMKYFATQIKNF